jgi:hypothetical protein
MVPTTNSRALKHGTVAEQEALRQAIQDQVAHYAKSPPEQLDRRLAQLDHEWELERALGTVTGAAALAGVILAATVHAWWLGLTAAAIALQLSQTVLGRSPLAGLFRRLGLRSHGEIEQERYALKALRGDFQQVPRFVTPEEKDALSRFEGEGGLVPEGEPDLPHATHVVDHVLEATRK